MTLRGVAPARQAQLDAPRPPTREHPRLDVRMACALADYYATRPLQRRLLYAQGLALWGFVLDGLAGRVLGA